jgi:hypothetical protein
VPRQRVECELRLATRFAAAAARAGGGTRCERGGPPEAGGLLASVSKVVS